MREEFLSVAREAALTGGRILLEHFGKPLDVRKKGPVNLVTAADVAAEEAILSILRRSYPQHGFLLEESTVAFEEREFVWVVDPLDGTTNFAHGYPVFCVSVGLCHQGRPVAGVVFDPLRQELFQAAEGQGASLNGRPIRVSSTPGLNDSLLVTGFPYDLRETPGDMMALFTKFLQQTQAVRRDGSAALDICYVAAGRFDGFWEQRLWPWDTAAGSVLVREAGGAVTRFDGSPFSVFDREILVSNGRIHDAMIGVIVGT